MFTLNACSFQKKMFSNLICVLIYSLKMVLKTCVFWKFCKTCQHISITEFSFKGVKEELALLSKKFSAKYFRESIMAVVTPKPGIPYVD